MFEIAVRCGNCGSINVIGLTSEMCRGLPLREFDCQQCKHHPLFMVRYVSDAANEHPDWNMYIRAHMRAYG